jgi:flagellar motility protein MotE (MotC chaperone)
MGRDPRDAAAHEIRNRIRTINDELDDEAYARDVAFDKDWQYRVSDARMEALKTERARLKEILGDL